MSVTCAHPPNNVGADILLPKRLGTPDILGRVDFEFRIFDERAKRKSAEITLCGDGPRRERRRGQGRPDAPQGIPCTGKLNNLFYAP